MGVYGLWASVVRYTPNLKTGSSRHDLTPFYFKHLGGNRTLNDFQILQRSAFLCNIIRFVYSDTTWHLPTMHRDKCCTETRWFF